MDGGAHQRVAAERAISWRTLVEIEPDRSAHRRLTYAQMAVFALLAGALVWALITDAAAALVVVSIVASALFAAALIWRLIAAAAALSNTHAPAPPCAETPRYTILCPLYREAFILPSLVAAIDRLDYPRAQLQVLLVLEPDDSETIAAAQRLQLGAHYTIVIAPDEGPRTKPKALDAALAHATGEFCTVYDAEDRPHAQQLRAAVAAFAQGGENLACVQAPLVIDNAPAGWISAQFATEYAVQFGQILPLLSRLGLPMPLGGTSNHFRIDALVAIGGWDAHNVTEDADLGYRLARHRYRVGAIDTPTYEEAPVRLNAWITQRTRWIKGHIQTWLVLMRNPWRTRAELGLGGLLSLHVVLGGAILAAFAHGLFAALLIYAALSPDTVLRPAAFALALTGYAIALYSGLVGAAAQRDIRLVGAALTMPLYWPLATIAAFSALFDLVLRPHYWAKTVHGVSARAEAPALAPVGAPERRRASDAPTPRQARAAAPSSRRDAATAARVRAPSAR